MPDQDEDSPAGPNEPAPWHDDVEAACVACGKTKPHTIHRINRAGKPALCNACHEVTP